MAPTEQSKSTPPRAALWLSRLAVLIAAALLLYTCSVCCPQLCDALRGMRNGRAVQAFSQFTQSLHAGSDVVEAFAASYELLTGAEP